jgi:hypothetical protein
MIFWDMTLCNLGRQQYFRGTTCFYLQDQKTASPNIHCCENLILHLPESHYIRQIFFSVKIVRHEFKALHHSNLYKC